MRAAGRAQENKMDIARASACPSGKEGSGKALVADRYRPLVRHSLPLGAATTFSTIIKGSGRARSEIVLVLGLRSHPSRLKVWGKHSLALTAMLSKVWVTEPRERRPPENGRTRGGV